MKESRLSRRDFLRLSAAATAGAIAVACAPPAAAPPPAEGEKAEEVAAKGVKPVPRNRTLILMFGGSAGEFTDTGLGNPYAVGATHQIGSAALWEPLYFYSAFADKMIPWLAESHEYNDDYTELTIKIRQGAEWSDGVPFTARDVAFTINMLKQHAPTLKYSTEMETWVKEATAVDDYTVRIVFNDPNPRFLFRYLTFMFDTGMYIVPEHVFKDVEDPSSFEFYDPEKGWPLCTGPYKIVQWTPTQKFIDLRTDWWAAKAGLAQLPKVERILMLPWSDETKAAQLVITDQIDSSLDLRPATIKSVLEQNPRIITHTYREPPYGYIDWWPISLWFNCAEPPFNNPDVRWAVSYAIDREQLVQVAYEGAGQATTVPFPYYPPLMKYIESISDLLEKYPTNKVDLAKSEALMKGAGYTKDSEGFWVDADGNRVEAVIHGFPIFADIGPIIAEQLRKAGFEASYTMPADSYTRMSDGTAKVMLFGHGGSIADPFYTLNMYHSRYARPVGESTPYFSRWANAEYDKIIEEMSTVPMGDPRMMDLFRRAMEIWLRELPDAPIVQWYHRIPMNTTYWKNWPTRDNPYVNGAFWHLTFPLILHRLEPAQ
ncbi:MAG TPA: ABC transporter substrate-binding protein [Caldilineae bacterium]|nr:ABC transporter substrate-binding protein [Caldilineae bacterium]